MKLKIYNTLTRTKEDFVPLMEDPNYHGPAKDFVGIYSCGPTVYYTPHIGNYRATFTADLIRNTLKLFGYPVKAVMNITDVGHLVSDADDGEDKLEKGARRDGITAQEVAKKYEQIFIDGMKDLNIDEFDVMPRATENIPEQIQLVKTLESKGYTYTIPGDGIYMNTSKVEEYGKLMGPNYKKRLADLNAGERIDMGGKKNPTDFALWKFSPAEAKRDMERESPRGMGFPGRHIECSAMSSKYLGTQFDIHHGGADHITIHHPNEIAQSECGFDVHPRVKYRMHNEFLQVDGGKMSKSLGNIYSLDDIKAKGYSPLDLRYFYFMAQYGNFQNFTWDILEQAKNSRNNLIKKISKFQTNNLFDKIESFTHIETQLNSEIGKKFRTEIMEA
ncbi:MAG: cysteine--tRNA ligase, partial [Candidatus Absconditicoccaceae bacterium]